MKIVVVSVILMVVSCTTATNGFSPKKKYYFSVSEKIQQKGISLILVDVKFTGNNTFITLFLQKNEKLRKCLKCKLFFSKRYDIKFIKQSEALYEYEYLNSKINIFENDQLNLLIVNRCNGEKYNYHLIRQEGEQEYPILH